MFLETFIKYLEVERGYSPHTLRAYETDLKLYDEYLKGVDGSLTLLDSDADLVRGWMANMMDKGCAVSSVCRKLSSLRAFFVYIKGKGLMTQNPVLALHAPKKRKRLPVFVKEEDMDRLFDAAFSDDEFLDIRDRAIFSCFYEMGLRLSELVGLRLSDVDFYENQVKVCGKRDKQRIIPFGESLKSLLLEYLDRRSALQMVDRDAFFVTKRGASLSASRVYNMVREKLSFFSTVKRRGPHTLRHTFATVMLNNDAEIGVVKELLGHRQLTTTEVYTHVTFEELKKSYKKAHPRAE